MDDIVPVLKGERLPAWEDALLIATYPELKMLITCLSVYEHPKDLILEEANNAYHFDITEEGLNMFLNYFWNIAEMTKLELYHTIADVLPLNY